MGAVRSGPLRFLGGVAATRHEWGRFLALSAAMLVGAFGLALPAAALVNTEPFAASQWGLRQVGAERAWDLTRGRGARVGIIDTGVDLGHAELAGRVVASTRCMGTGGLASRCAGSAQDDSGHGTHVAGIIAAPLDQSGVAGVAPEASLLVVKVLDATGSGEAADAAAGIDWLISQRVDVVNLSLAETPSLRRVVGSPLEAAIRRASASGAVVVLAAGNHIEPPDGRTAFDLPAIVVAASDRDARLARYSLPLTSGVRYGLMAPGGDSTAGVQGEVVSTYWFAGRTSAYAWSEGTSMAAPHVAGALALLAAQGVRGQAAVDRLLTTAAAVECGTGCRGLLDVAAAVGAPTAPVPAPKQAAPKQVEAASGSAPVATAAPPRTQAAQSTTVPATVAPVLATPVGDQSTGPQPESAPVDEEVALEVPARRQPTDTFGRVLVAAALALLVITATTAAFSLRRIRADARR